MLIKLFCAMAICVCSWLLGNGYKASLNEKIKIVEDYISFAITLKSAVMYSGKNLYNYVENLRSERLRRFFCCLIENKNAGIEECLKKYEPVSRQERECINILYPSLVLLETSSDVYGISEQINESISLLEIYKNEIREAYCGKIKTAPSLALITGLFIAVLLI